MRQRSPVPPTGDADVPRWLAELGSARRGGRPRACLPEPTLRKVCAHFARAVEHYGYPWPITYRFDEPTRVVAPRPIGVTRFARWSTHTSRTWRRGSDPPLTGLGDARRRRHPRGCALRPRSAAWRPPGRTCLSRCWPRTPRWSRCWPCRDAEQLRAVQGWAAADERLAPTSCACCTALPSGRSASVEVTGKMATPGLRYPGSVVHYTGVNGFDFGRRSRGSVSRKATMHSLTTRVANH